VGYEPWKIVMLVFISAHYVYKMIGVIHVFIILNDAKEIKERYARLPKTITDILTLA